MNISCDQKQSKEDGTCEIMSDILGRLDISNNDELLLFQDPPPKEDCPICMLPMPHSSGICGVHVAYQACCGKMLCYGCIMTSKEEMIEGRMKAWCAFCRVSLPRSEKEATKRLRKRIKLGDAEAFNELGINYQIGRALPKDMSKAIELWKQGAALGSIMAHYNLATALYFGDGVEKDTEKALHHYRFAAIGGHEKARHVLGHTENKQGNVHLAMKHYMISARAGFDDALKCVGSGYKAGHVTKQDYTNTLRAHQVSVDEMKSKERTKAETMYD